MAANRNSIIRMALVGLAAATVPTAGPAIAQQASPPAGGAAASANGDVAENVLTLDRIVIGAGREKVAIDTPQSVTVIDQDGIDREQATTIGDVLDDIPGVKAVGSDRIMGESFNIRGLGGATAADEPRLIVSVDGATKFYEQYRMGSFFSDPELYKRVEVLRGPASSTLYGSGALAGVINLTTKDASDFLDKDESWMLREKLQYGTNDGEFLTSTIAAGRPTKDIEVLASANYRRMNEYTDGSGETESGTDGTSHSGLGKIRYRFGENRESALSASVQQWRSSQNDQPYSQTGLSGGVFSSFGTVDRAITDTTATAKFEHASVDNPLVNLSVTASYAESLNKQSDVSPSLVNAFGNGWEVSYQTTQVRLENGSAFSGAGWSNYLTYGLQAIDQDRVSKAFKAGVPFAVGSHPAGSSETIGAYVQSEFVYHDWLTLIPGMRFDRIALKAADSVSAAVTERSHDYNLYSPKLAVHAKLTQNYALFGSIAHTERAPVLDELYDTDGQIGLEPEKSNNYEAGFALSFSDVMRPADALRTKVTFFYNDIYDLIHRDADGQAYFNAEGETLKGAEVETGYDAGTVFGSLGYSFIRGKLFDGRNLDTVPADEIVVTLGGRVPEEHLTFGYKGVFAAAQNLVSNIHATAQGGGKPTSGYAVHNLFASWQPDEGVLGGTEFRIGIDNVLDKSYRQHLSGDDAKGRTVYLTVAKKF